jgi:hypothetical protein
MSDIASSTLLLCWKILTLQHFWISHVTHTGLQATDNGNHWMKLHSNKVTQSEHKGQSHTYTSIHTIQLSQVTIYPVYIWWYSWIDSRKSFRATTNTWRHNANQYVDVTFPNHKWSSWVTLWGIEKLVTQIRSMLWKTTVCHRMKLHCTCYILSTIGLIVCHCSLRRPSCYRKKVARIYFQHLLTYLLRGLSQQADYTDQPKLVPTSADRGCHVVSVTDPYGRIIGFLDRTCYVNPIDNTHYVPITTTPSTCTKYSHKILH